MKFQYTAKDSDGNITEGTMSAVSEDMVAVKLQGQGLGLLTAEELAENPVVVFLNNLNPFKPKVKGKDIVIFSRQLSTLIDAGVPLVQGLSVLVDQAQTPIFKDVLTAIKNDIESGHSIADAMSKHPDTFDTLYVSMIRAGEVGGILDVILQRLSGYLESAQELRGKVKSAMVYPGVVMSIAGLITVFLLIFIIPTFKEIFAGFGAELPAPTIFVLGLSDFLKGNFFYILIVLVAIFFGLKKYYQTENGRLMIDNYFLRLPIFGLLLKKVAIAKFTRTLGTLIKSGVPILHGLETVAATSGNVIIEKTILACREEVKEGGRLVKPLRESDVFPPMVTQMINVGEETGSIDIMLVKIADFYDKEVDNAVKGLTSMIEPVMIVVMGVIIGTIVIAMMLPMLSLGELAGNIG